jgi:surface carbohydrate biosynthesis protein
MPRFRILIHADSLIRDTAWALVLAQLFENRGFQAVVSSRPSTGFLLRTWRPHALVHSQAHAIRGYYDLGLVGGEGKPLVAFSPHEGNNVSERYLNDTYRGLLDSEAPKFLLRAYHWNELNRDWFRANSAVPESGIWLLGNPRLDLAKFGHEESGASSRSGIGFIGRFPSLNKHDGTTPFYHSMSAGSSDDTKEIVDFRIREMSRQVAVAHWYAFLTKKLMAETDLPVSIRPHHEERPHSSGYRALQTSYGSRISIDQSLSLFDWMKNLSAMVSTSSLTMVEAYLSKTPVICIDKLSSADKIFLDIHRDEQILSELQAEDRTPTSISQTMVLIEQAAAGELKFRQSEAVDRYLMEQYNWPYKGSVLAEIADDVVDSLLNMPDRRLRAYAPPMFGDLYYLFRAVMGPPFGQPSLTVRKTYSRLIHGKPEFIERTATAIDSNR